MQLVLLVQVGGQPMPGAGRVQRCDLVLSGAASILPLTSPLLYVRVLGVGGTSTVAHLS